MEALWANDSIFTTSSWEWKLIRKHKSKLMNSDKMFSCLMGYGAGEKKLMNGERTGKLGSKRKNTIDAYGYSNKNCVQLFRLYYCGIEFFSRGIYPVNIKEYNSEFHKYLMAIKTNPQDFKVEDLNKVADEYEITMKLAYNRSTVSFKFSDTVANDISAIIYNPAIYNHVTKNINYLL